MTASRGCARTPTASDRLQSRFRDAPSALLNPDSEVYAEVVQSYVDGQPKDVIRDVSLVGEDNVGTEWRPIDEPRVGSRVRYRYTGTAELQVPDGAEASA
jgi:hypothetical protein